jgi:hypothetical protein
VTASVSLTPHSPTYVPGGQGRVSDSGFWHWVCRAWWYHPILMTAPLVQTMMERPRMIRIGLMLIFCCSWRPFKVMSLTMATAFIY